MCVNKDAARDSSQVLFELSKFKICYDQDKNCHLISQEATQKNLIKMHKRTNSEDKNDIHILYLYWLKPLLKVVRARAWAPFITADGVFVLSRCTATVNNWFLERKRTLGESALDLYTVFDISVAIVCLFLYFFYPRKKSPPIEKITTIRKSRWEKQL